MFKISISTLFFLLVASSTSRAQGAWTLQECIDYAVTHSAMMEVQQANNRIQDINLRDAQLNLVPGVSAGAGGGYNFGRTLDPETNTYNNIQYFGSSYTMGASMPLFAGLTNINSIRYERYGKLKGRKDAQMLADNLSIEVLHLYYEALYQEGLVALAREQIELSAKEVTKMRRQAELGLKAKADIAEAEAKEAADAYYLINRENGLEIALMNLKRKMSYPVDDPLVMEATPEELRQVVGAWVRADSLYIVALELLPHSASSLMAVQQAKARVSIQRGNLLPNLSLGAGINSRFYNTNKNMETGSVIPFTTQLSNNASEYVELSLRIPIFSGLYRVSNLQRAKQSLRIAQTNHDDLLQEVYKEVQRAVQDLNASVKAYDQAVKQERARELAYNVNQKKYEEGLLSILDLHTSANLLLAAKVETIGNLMKMNAQRRIVAYYEGTPLTTINTTD